MTLSNVEDLMAMSDIADMVGVERAVVSNWKKRYKGEFPTPVSTFGGRDVYDRNDVINWLKSEMKRRRDNAKRNVSDAEYALQTARNTLAEADAMWTKVRSLRTR